MRLIPKHDSQFYSIVDVANLATQKSHMLGSLRLTETTFTWSDM